MEILMSITVGVLFMIGTYLLLSKSLLRIVLALIILSHGAHFLLLTMGGLQTGGPPLLNLNVETFTDPLPQALVLTAIVISFGMTSFLLVLSYRTYKVFRTDDLDQLRGSPDE
ncbi:MULTISPECIES: Na(+)/H(+) antiporter subunit C [unclassified Exiguobacterium]|uniref:Na(+)/H(+) antiporter subunit C n=1 Tax=unclassified Exiguobacterium TaxID=2644629 RepID=UPI00103DE21A|nr:MULTISPECIES: Na(+)/H(+) antiporter subunit C [unclassified Exiguobacterium]TCI69648.1 Na(+)/H(+) antiporter subunit C [Exiguobacterium sp. IPCI3]TCI78945.1 Na(+)/H(+) antiporter subunit C [Exiguobacterium sp. IPCH1]TCI81532.1 Na(+)/H(+) antiporter subunit C [Exiguobacterium sp. IPBC4]